MWLGSEEQEFDIPVLTDANGSPLLEDCYDFESEGAIKIKATNTRGILLENLIYIEEGNYVFVIGEMEEDTANLLAPGIYDFEIWAIDWLTGTIVTEVYPFKI